ncbi:hypothetical protein O181_085244 [Austropuccinia psidii MF-1]|uniref:Chromo domain-containing protein n=1 Tax=Austropuccinia psidii MF-1 TaxID=1389203 RepID=A0A9Q3IMW9_9BASI|nr:hypothetical protein [Austropuccinia psidii MF-1]
MEVILTEKFSMKHPVFPVSFVKPCHQTGLDNFPSRNNSQNPLDMEEVENSPGQVKNIIKARKLRLNGKDHRNYLVRLKNQTFDQDKWLEEDVIPNGEIHLRRFRDSRRA